jgi:glycosyltransferase involved in cell wall biosynthesis
VLSSLIENLPTVIIEALALGVPVVSFDCPEGPREILTHGKDGLLVPLGDIRGLSRAIQDIIDRPRLANSLRFYGFARAQDFTFPRTITAYEALFNEL